MGTFLLRVSCDVFPFLVRNFIFIFIIIILAVVDINSVEISYVTNDHPTSPTSHQKSWTLDVSVEWNIPPGAGRYRHVSIL